MKSYTVQQYITAGCPEMDVSVMVAVHGKTGGKVCDTGCHAFNGGKCPSYKKLTAVPIVVKVKNQAMTNKEFARNNKSFRDACHMVIVKDNETLPETSRQASKYRNGKGAAYKAMMNSRKEVQP